MSFEPAVTLKLPWAAVLGNHDQESTLSREGVMRNIVSMPYTLSKLNPDSFDIDGFGNYNLEIYGAEGSSLSNKSVLNLYFLDSGDYSTVPSVPGYGWIKASQQVWFKQTSSRLQVFIQIEPLLYYDLQSSCNEPCNYFLYCYCILQVMVSASEISKFLQVYRLRTMLLSTDS